MSLIAAALGRIAAPERRTVAVACGAHILHDGYTDLLYVLLPLWQAQFGLGYAEVGLLRALYVGAMAGFQIPAGAIAERVGAPLILGLGTALAGIAGLVIALTYSFSSASVQPWTVIAFAVAVIGGKGSTTGILVAGLTVGFVEAAVAATFSANWIYLAVYTLLLLMFLFRPSGILGERA